MSNFASPIPTPAEMERRRVYALERLAGVAERFMAMCERIEQQVLAKLAEDDSKRRSR